jgi:hypothetical protein
MTTTQHNTSAMIGYARCSTARQDLTAQRELLQGLGVASDRIYLDHGLNGTNRARPGLDQALAAVRAGDTLVVPKLDRLARSVPDARAIGDQLVAHGVKLGGRGTLERKVALRGVLAGQLGCGWDGMPHPQGHDLRVAGC